MNLEDNKKQKMRVLQVNKLYYPEVGGIEKTLQQVSEGLNRSVDLKVLVCQKKGAKVQEEVNGVWVHRAGSLGVVASVPISFSFLWKLRQLSKNMDIVHFHMPFPLGDLGCLLSGYQGKVVAYWHSDVVKQKRWMVLYRPVMEAFLKRADIILVGAQGIAEGSDYLGPYLNKCRVVPFAVTDKVLKEGGHYLEDNGYRREHDILHFLFVGRLGYYKGVSLLLEAAEQLMKKDKYKTKFKLTIIGKGILEEELKQKCRDAGMESQVEFLGQVSDEQLRTCYETADVFVLPSTERSEAFGLVQLEAMAYGLPVINTNLKSGVPQVSLHGQTGLTVEPNSAARLAEAMEWMLSHPQERIVMGEAARKRVEENFTEQVLIGNLQEIYKELLERK